MIARTKIRNTARGIEITDGVPVAAVRTITTEARRAVLGAALSGREIARGATIATVRIGCASGGSSGNAASPVDVAGRVQLAAVRVIGAGAMEIDVGPHAALLGLAGHPGPIIAAIRNILAAGIARFNAARSAVAGCIRVATVRVQIARILGPGRRAALSGFADHRAETAFATVIADNIGAAGIAQCYAACAPGARSVRIATVGGIMAGILGPVWSAAPPGIADHRSIYIATVRLILATYVSQTNTARPAVACCVGVAAVRVDIARILGPGRRAAPPCFAGHRSEKVYTAVIADNIGASDSAEWDATCAPGARSVRIATVGGIVAGILGPVWSAAFPIFAKRHRPAFLTAM